jgi:hypothetical protein
MDFAPRGSVRQIFYLALNSNREEKIQLMTNDRSAQDSLYKVIIFITAR